LYVSQSIVAGRVQDTKTEKRKAPVPVAPTLTKYLEHHWKREGTPKSGPIFRTSKKTPLDPNNALHDQILPALNRCKCGKNEDEHLTADHKYERDNSRPGWRGWHDFRAGVATRLHELEIQDKTTQGVLRHSNVSVTQACYIKTTTKDSQRAIAALDSAMCSTCALDSLVSPETRVQ
jgi:integrase